jgi:hypothetical protein
MNQAIRKIVGVVAAVSLSAGLMLSGISAGWAQQEPLRAKLVGAWTLVSVEVTAKSGAKRPGLAGANAKGILILDNSGQYAQVTGRPDRQKLTTTVRKGMNAAELGEAARAFGGVFGSWSVSEVDKVLILKRVLSLIPNNDNTEIRHSVSLSRDELKLVGVSASASGGRTELLYRRVK